jgi:hypothetical protein
MSEIPSPADFTSAPLRHRLKVELHGRLADVWALVGDHERLSEYSAGISQVELATDRNARTCFFLAPDGTSEGIVLREIIRWEAPMVGYATSALVPNDFGLTNDLALVTLAAVAGVTALTWEQYYDHPDLPMMRANFDEGLVDIGQRLTDRFGGRIVERYVDET